MASPINYDFFFAVIRRTVLFVRIINKSRKKIRQRGFISTPNNSRLSSSAYAASVKFIKRHRAADNYLQLIFIPRVL